MGAAPVKETSSKFIILTKTQDGALKKTPPKIAIKKVDISSVEEIASYDCRRIIHGDNGESVNVTETFEDIMAELD